MAERRRVLIVDDDAVIRSQLGWALSDEYDVSSAATAADALRELRERSPDVVTLDLSLTARPGESEEGLDILAAAQECRRPPKVVMLTGSTQREHAVRAIDLGAFDYCEKPVDVGELLVLLRRAIRVRDLEGTGEPEEADRRVEGPCGMVGSCPAMAEALALIRTAAATDAPVLLIGESGTGKRRAARTIHELSARAGGPFVAVDASALPERAVEDDVFGPASNGRPPGGLLAEARDGTLYIANLRSLPPSAQARLAAFLASVEPGRDARIVASSDSPLDSDARTGRFRGDLYCRLAVIAIPLPPVRERQMDVLALAEAALESAALAEGRRTVGFTKAAERAMLAHDWPENVTEVEARVRRAVIMARGRLVSATDLGLPGDAANGREHTLTEVRNGAERELLESALRETGGNVSRAARAIGVSRPTLYDLMRKHGITATRFKGRPRQHAG